MGAPTLGYGQRGEVAIDHVNQYMRAAPWYQALLKSFGQDPSNVHLNDQQKQQVIRAAQANGIVVDEGHNGQEIDDSGNFQAKGHGLRNTLIVAGIAGAALATMGAAGVYAGGAGAGAGGGAAAAGGAAGAGAAGAAGGAGVAAAGASAVPWSTIIGAGSSLFGNLFAAHEQAAGADRAAQLQSEAAKYSADQIAKANADALKFSYANAENAFQNNEAARQGNYGVFAAREGRLGTLGEAFGFGSRPVPAYVPGVDPHFGDGTASASMTGTNGAPASGGIDPKVASFIADWQKSHSVSEGIGPLADAIAKQFPGVSRYMYGATPSDNELLIGGQKYKVLGGEHTRGAYWYQPGMNDAAPAMGSRTATAPYASAPYGSVPIAPGVQIPQPLGFYA